MQVGTIELLVGLSAVAQLAAAILALRLTRLTGRRSAWLLLAGAFVLMAIRRTITLYQLWRGDIAPPADPWAESVALVISLLVLVGVLRIRSLLDSVWHTDRALRVERAFLAQLFENAPEAIIVADNDSRLQRANSEFTRLFGYTIEEAVGRRVDDLLAPGPFHDEARRLTWEVAGGRTVVLDTMRRCKDGTLLDVSLVGTPITVEGGQVGVYGIYRDISNRKRAEEGLRRSEARLRLLMEQMPAVLWTTDRDLRFTSSVGAGLAALGLQVGEVVGRTLFDFFETTDAEFLPIAVHRRALEGRPGTYELEWAGNFYQAHVQPLLDGSGAAVGCVGVALDLTERRALEAQLRQAQKMEAVGQLTGGIAHDFNNLLTVILANAEIVGNHLVPDIPEAKTDLDELLNAARRGRTLVRKLLGFGRRSALEFQEVDLAQLLTGLSEVLDRVMPDNIEMQIVGETTSGTVRADPTALEQILINLATNARDAMPEGGILRIGLERRWLDQRFCAAHPGSMPGEYACLSVSDSGIGMDEEVREHIFEPFFTTKPPDVGTGLVKQHHGFVDVASVVGQGTKVEVYFPISGEGGRVPLELRHETAELRGGTESILVVDDEPAIRRATKRTLEGYGYSVLLAADGEQALEILRDRRNRIDLVVTDLMMPKVGGRELYQTLKREGIPVKVLVTSGYVGRDGGERAGLAPGVPFLDKPWTPSDLLLRVRALLDQSATP